jgi:hypothetical protein
MIIRTAYTFALALVVLACSSSEPNVEAPKADRERADDVPRGSDEPYIRKDRDTYYTGWSEGAAFRLEIRAGTTPQSAKVTWTSDDPSSFEVAETTTPTHPESKLIGAAWHWAVVTPKKAGSTTVRARIDGASEAAWRVVVTGFTAEELAAGKVRYEIGGTRENEKPCASCHAKADGRDHSPTLMSWYSDAEILSVVEDAKYPAGEKPEQPLQFEGHRWALTEIEKNGIIGHLRMLPYR